MKIKDLLIYGGSYVTGSFGTIENLLGEAENYKFYRIDDVYYRYPTKKKRTIGEAMIECKLRELVTGRLYYSSGSKTQLPVRGVKKK